MKFSPANVEEVTLAKAKITVAYNARLKAEEVTKHFPKNLIIACDTVVSLDEKILGKPANMQKAYEMLKSLAGRWHQVYTSVYITYQGKVVEWVSIAKVKFKNLDDELLKKYCQKVNPLDKAGAYNINEQEISLVEAIQGDKTTIMGLPIREVKQALKKF